MTDGTVLLGLYGIMRLHPWLDNGNEVPEDAYSLFASRASAMGWSSSGVDATSSDYLWGMNEAGDDWSSGGKPTRLAWYQVGVRDPASAPLPVQPIFACAEASLARVGAVEIQTVQTMLPVKPVLDFTHHLQTSANGFALVSPTAKTPVRITIDTGASDNAVALVEGAAAHIAALPDIPVEVAAVSTNDTASVVPEPATDDGRIGPSHHRSTIHGRLAEWSMTSLGWTTELVTHALARSGADQNVLITIGADTNQSK